MITGNRHPRPAVSREQLRELTRSQFEPLYGRTLSDQDVDEIIANLCEFSAVLLDIEAGHLSEHVAGRLPAEIPGDFPRTGQVRTGLIPHSFPQSGQPE